MKRIILTIAAAIAAILIVLPVSAGGPKSATISLDQAQPVSGNATFTVAQQNYKNPYNLWVANKCYLGGVLVNAEYRPVAWNAGEATGSAGPFETSGLHQAGGDPAPPPVPWASDSCTAYVWEFPASETPERGAIITFTVN